MDRYQMKEYYLDMINGLLGLQDDLNTNGAPPEARSLMEEVIRLCRVDYEQRIEKMFRDQR